MFFKRNMKKIILWTLVLAWMVLIFCLSAQDSGESGDLSGGIISRVLCTLFGYEEGSPELAEAIDGLQFFIRKFAHFFEYCVLGVLCSAAIYQHTDALWKRLAFPSALAAIYSVSDEIHQIFVPGRACQLRDVVIDILGAVLGVALFAAVYMLATAPRKPKTEKKVKIKKKK